MYTNNYMGQEGDEEAERFREQQRLEKIYGTGSIK
jgi:hypothetical protein